MGSEREIIKFEGGDFLTAKCKTRNVKVWVGGLVLGRSRMDLEWISDERVHGVCRECAGTREFGMKIDCGDVQKTIQEWPAIQTVIC